MARHKFQVFISSTFADLHQEREAVSWEILELRHIPAGMENFPATPDRGWKIIQRAIDDSDYYVLLIAGRYGSVDPTTGVSWTEREYDYAMDKGIPVLAFVREKSSITNDKVETDHGRSDKLAAFIKKIDDAHLRKGWTTKEDLAGKVVQALNRAIQDDEDDGTRRPGWVRGDSVAADAVKELTRLSKENADLRTELESVRSKSNEALLEVKFDGEAIDGVTLQPSLEIFIPHYVLEAPNELADGSIWATFASRAARTVWLTGRVHNNGAGVARKVKFRLVAHTKIVGFEYGSFDKRFASASPLARANPTPQELHSDASRDVHLLPNSSRIARVATVEQRLQSIGVRHDERFINVGFVLPNSAFESSNTFQFVLEFSATSEVGEHVSGKLEVTARRGRVVRLPPSKLKML